MRRAARGGGRRDPLAAVGTDKGEAIGGMVVLTREVGGSCGPALVIRRKTLQEDCRGWPGLTGRGGSCR